MIDIPANTQRHCLTGSHYICNPPVTDTDFDIALYVLPDQFVEYCRSLIADGWEVGGSRTGEEGWLSFKKQHTDGVLYNFIVTCNETYYENFYLATEVAKKLNLRNKEDRVMLFSAFCEGTTPNNNAIPF